jgi:CBS domain-containing protein
MIGEVLLSEIFPILITRHEITGTVADHMTRDVVTCQEGDHITRIYNLIVESGFTAFPVMRRKKLAGIVSRRDLLNAGRVRKALDHTAAVPGDDHPGGHDRTSGESCSGSRTAGEA